MDPRSDREPGLSSDAGFAAVLARAGISFEEAVERILGGLCDEEILRCPKETLGPRTNRVRNRCLLTGRQSDASSNPPDSFPPNGVDVAIELVDERLSKGTASGYYFLFAEREGLTIGYACYGPIACTQHSYDLFWIAVDVRHQRSGLGRHLLS